MKEAFLIRSAFAKQHASRTTDFIYPKGIRHMLAIPATLDVIVSFLQEKGFLVSGPSVSGQRHDLPPLIHYTCTWKHGIRSSGAHTDPLMAQIKAISEGLERVFTYSSEYNLNQSYVFKKVNPRLIVNPFPKISYFQEQLLAYPRLGIQEEFGTYVRFYSVGKKGERFLPEECLYWGQAKNQALVSRTSNGSGAHPDRQQALLSALHECIERDAFMYHWLCKLPPQKLDAGSVRRSMTADLLTSLQEMGIEAVIFVLDNNVGIPTFATALIDRRQEPSTFVVAGAVHAFDYEEAIYKSIEEALAILQESLELKENIETTHAPPFSDAAMGRKERIALWKGRKVEELSWLFSGETVELARIREEKPELAREEQSPEEVVRRMEKNFGEINVLYTYIQSPVLNQVRLHVAKVVIPEFIQFYLVEHLSNLNNNKRLMEALSTSDLYAHINPAPHPYP